LTNSNNLFLDWFSLLNYAGNHRFVEIVIVTLIFSDVVPQLNILLFSELFVRKTSLLPYFIIILCSVFKVQLPTSFEVRSQSPSVNRL